MLSWNCSRYMVFTLKRSANWKWLRTRFLLNTGLTPLIIIIIIIIIWTTCKIRYHVFTIFDARIGNVKCKNKNVLEVLNPRNIFRSFEDFKLLEHFNFYILHFPYVRRMWLKDVMSYFASSSSYSNTFLVSAFTTSQK